MSSEKHTQTARLLGQLNDTDMFLCGCEDCGPQLVVTADWHEETVSLFWIHRGGSIQCHSDGTVTIQDDGATHGG